MTQPALGVVASVLSMAAALAFIALFDFGTFVGWASFGLLCLIPTQIIIVVLWGARPPFAAAFSQPARGVLLLLTTLAAGAVIAPMVLAAVGDGVSPPGPIPSHFATIVVPTTFWLSIMWGGWPFTRVVKHPVAAGVAVLVAVYAVTYVLFRLFFDYGFMVGAPVYLASAPQGAFNAVSALVFYVTALAGMFLLLCFDLWPLTASPRVMTQPMLGAVWTLASAVLGAVAMWIGVGVLAMDPMIFLTRVTVPFIFGSIIVLNMLENSLFATRKPPVKGVMNAAAAVVVGVALARLYGALAPMVTGVLPSGAPGYEFEIWLANALLSVTFPFLIFYAAYFGFWPLARRP